MTQWPFPDGAGAFVARALVGIKPYAYKLSLIHI